MKNLNLKRIASKVAVQLGLKVELMGTAKLEDGTEVHFDTEALESGSMVYTVDEEGVQTPLADGDYVLEDGGTFTVAEGSVTAYEATMSDDGEDDDDGKDDEGKKEENLSREELQTVVNAVIEGIAVEMAEQRAAILEEVKGLIEEAKTELSKKPAVPPKGKGAGSDDDGHGDDGGKVVELSNAELAKLPMKERVAYVYKLHKAKQA